VGISFCSDKAYTAKYYIEYIFSTIPYHIVGKFSSYLYIFIVFISVYAKFGLSFFFNNIGGITIYLATAPALGSTTDIQIVFIGYFF